MNNYSNNIYLPDISSTNISIIHAVSDVLTEDLKEYGTNEKKNINKEKTRNNNQPYAFINGGDFGEQITLNLFPNTIGSASKGGMAYDNKTLNKDKELISAREVKFVSLVGTKKCKTCNNKCPPFQTCCIYCNSNDFKKMSDSRAGISSDAHIKYKNIINEYIIYVQDYNDDTNIITIKGYKFLSTNNYFNGYIQNQYDSGKNKGGNCNFIPYSYDWVMSGPISIINVDIDISNIEPIITYHLYNPQSEIYDDVSMVTIKKILNSHEQQKFQEQIILDNKMINNGYIDYEYIKSIFNIRNKCIGKSRGSTCRK
tara:strand:+ start:92 stop:1030 length:939 start_codon:yes stop_codon:yes gene_type:complete